MLVRQLEEELRMRSLQNPSHEVRHQVEAMYAENDHLSREVSILRETVKVIFLYIYSECIILDILKSLWSGNNCIPIDNSFVLYSLNTITRNWN